MEDFWSDVLSNGKHVFHCPTFGCNVEWPYFVVRHVACSTTEKKQKFDMQISENYLQRSAGMQQCPGCRTWCFRALKTTNCMECPICTEQKGVASNFCWVCLGKWKGTREEKIAEIGVVMELIKES